MNSIIEKDKTSKMKWDDMFIQALKIRMVEEKIIELYSSDKIQSPVHLSIGQEAVAVGVCRELLHKDWLFSTYRSHAYYLAKGGNLKQMFAELFGKSTGGAKGKAGSMHLTAPEVGFMGSSAVVASSLPHAAGAAYATKFKNDGRVHVVVFGDGATEEGVYFETLNFAALHKLPILFVCENNGLAVHSRQEARQSYQICDIVKSFGITSTYLKEGYDFLAVGEACRPLIDAVRKGQGPKFIEIDTCRYKEHVGPGDDFDDGYRSHDEASHWFANDPLILEIDMVAQLTDGLATEIDEAVAFAEESPWPTRNDLLTDVDHPNQSSSEKSPLTLSTGERRGVLSYRNALFYSMKAGLEDNSKAIIIGQGVDDHNGIFGTTQNLHKKFGSDRVFDTPLMEEGVAGIALGASLNGLYPIQTHIRSDFMLLSANQIINLIAKYRYMFGGRFQVPMLIRAVIGRSWGQGAQHSQSLQSLFAHIPGLTVIAPSEPQSILETYPYLINNYQGPVISFEHRLMYDLSFKVDWGRVAAPKMPLTSRKIRNGKDVTIVATSIMVLEAQRAAQHLYDHDGIECDIIDLHCVSHPDEKMIIDSVRKTGRLVVGDTSWVPYGVAAEICRIVCQSAPEALRAPVVMLGMAQAPCPTAKSLEDLYYPNLADLVDKVAELVTGYKDHGVPLPNEQSMADVYKRFKGPF